MIGKTGKIVSDELISNLKLALAKGIEMVVWSPEINPLDLQELRKVWIAFGKIKTEKANVLCLYEINSGGLSKSECVNLPTLELKFEDPKIPGDHNIVFVEGKENVIKVLTELADAQLEHRAAVLKKLEIKAT